MYNTILFDADGTLSDSKPGIRKGIEYSLSQFNMKLSEEGINRFLGPPIRDSFRDFCNFDEDKCELAVKYYREYYSTTGLLENTLYPGMRELLTELKKQGKRLMVATSKPQPFTDRIMEYFKIDGLFDIIVGASMDGSMDRKADIIRYALESCGVADDPSKALMVGDRKYDMIGANEVGTAAVGVLYGYGSREELELSGATYIAESVQDILKYAMM